MAYSGVYVFGDSLVDAGNALELAEFYGDLTFSDLPEGAPSDELGYFRGRFSDGYSFADLIANKTIGVVTKPIFPYFYEDPWLGIKIAPWASDPNGNNLNFAYGGAQLIQGGEAVPDLDGQTDAFRHAVDGDADPNALYLITMGGNDVRSLAPSGSAPASEAEAHAALEAAAEKLLHELSQLIDIGAHNILITGVPDVGLIPQYDRDGNLILDAAELARSQAATEYSVYLDTLIRTEVVPALQALGAVVTYVPLMDYVDASGNLVTGALSANLPTIAALHGLTTDELSGNLLGYQNLLFFDQIHPNAQANALLGAYMYASLTGMPWIETLPLVGADIDYRMTGSIAAIGEVDKLVVSLVAGTTYTLEMLGMSSLGTAGSLADPSLRLLGPNNSVVAFNADDGAGFDATLTFTVATSGLYTLEMSATGSVLGTYALQAAMVGGAALNAGNTYTISNAATLVIEGAGGIGMDVVKASVSYALSEGSEIEVLRTTNDKGKTAINLTGNEFDQTIIGNSGNNVIEGKGGADVLTGKAGKDVFVLSNLAVTDPGPANIDTISDYAAGDVVDITQVLNVAAGTNVLTGGYLRVTTSGRIQVDLDGGGDEWVTLSTINGNGAVAVRYLSGGTVTNVSVSRVTESQLKSMSAVSTSGAVTGAVAAAGLLAVPAAAESVGEHSLLMAADAALASGDRTGAQAMGELARLDLTGETREIFDGNAWARPVTSVRPEAPQATDDRALAGDGAPARTLTELLPGSEVPGNGDAAADSLVAHSVAMPSAEMLLAAMNRGDAHIEDVQSTAEVGRVLAGVLDNGRMIDALLAAIPGGGGGADASIEALAGHAAAAIGPWHAGMFSAASDTFVAATMIVHHDAPPSA